MLTDSFLEFLIVLTFLIDCNAENPEIILDYLCCVGQS